MVKCCVPECAAPGTKTFHAFPANEEVRRQWIKNTKTFHLTEKELKGYAKVCAYHFRESDFETNCRGQRGLTKNTIPTLRLPSYVANFQTEHDYCISPNDVPYQHSKKKIKRAVEATVVEESVNTVSSVPQISIENNHGFEEPAEVSVVGEYVLVEMEVLRKKNKDNCEAFKLKEAQLIEENKQLKKKLRELSKKLRINRKKNKKIRQHLKCHKMNDGNVMEYLRQIFNPTQMTFFEMQIQNSRKKRNARRYTAEAKSLSLILYRQSPKNYRSMQNTFALPSISTLGRYSARLAFETGINPKLFAYIKSKVDTMSENEKLCSLLWDEVSFKAHLGYSPTRDQIDGFVDHAYVRTSGFATHALTFMVRGIRIPYKQPIGYFFTEGLKAFELVEMIKLMTEAVLDTGLNVVVSTCDQASTNVKAVHELIDPVQKRVKASSGGLLSYKIRDHVIVHCYDPPHLLKGIRNNLMTKKLIHHISKRWNVDNSVNKDRRMSSWKHVKESYEYSLKATTKLLPKISAEHINPKKSKMKVSLAAQIFSQTFGNMLLKCSNNRQLPKRYADTAEVLLFFNDVFDSINGSSSSGKNPLKAAVTENSIHFSFWKYAIHMLSKMDFLDAKTGKPTNRTCVLQHFQSTIRGYIEVCEKCFKLDVTEVSLRYLILNFRTHVRCYIKVLYVFVMSSTTNDS